MLNDKEAAKYVSGVAFHWYENQNANWNDLDQLQQQFPKTFILATEACEEWKGQSQHVKLGSWATFNRYAIDIIRDLNHFTAGWTDWNIAVDTRGGPNWAGNFVDAPIIVNETGHEYYKQPIYYAMGHFSKFLVPDSVRIHHDAKGDFNNVELTTFKRPDGGIVVIILNSNNHPISMLVNDSQNGYVYVNVKAQSMQNLVWY